MAKCRFKEVAVAAEPIYNQLQLEKAAACNKAIPPASLRLGHLPLTREANWPLPPQGFPVLRGPLFAVAPPPLHHI